MQAFPWHKTWFAPAAALASLIVAALMGLTLNAAVLEPLIVENGPFEIASVGLHLAVGAFALYHWRKGNSIAGILFLASLLMAGRELDLHKAFTTYGIFGTRLYFRDYVPLHEKILAISAVVAIAAALLGLIWRARQAIREMGRRKLPGFYALITLPLFVLALKELDGLPRMLRKVGVVLSHRETLISRSIEEIGETFIPLLVMIIVIQVTRPLLTSETSPHEAG